jgi:hypothetical protein
MPQEYLSTPQVLSNGQSQNPVADVVGGLIVSSTGTAQNITTATTTTVKTGAGVLHKLIIGTTAAGTITIYDNTAGSGTIIAKFKASMPEGVYVIDASFAIGLTVVTGAASDISVVYR